MRFMYRVSLYSRNYCESSNCVWSLATLVVFVAKLRRNSKFLAIIHLSVSSVNMTKPFIYVMDKLLNQMVNYN